MAIAITYSCPVGISKLKNSARRRPNTPQWKLREALMLRKIRECQTVEEKVVAASLLSSSSLPLPSPPPMPTSSPSLYHQKSPTQQQQWWQPPPQQQRHHDSKLSLLERLPQEILDLVARRLDYLSLLRLQAVSRRLRASVDPGLAPAESKFALAMRAERDLPRNRDRLACYLCYTVQPARCFAENQPAAIVLRHQGGTGQQQQQQQWWWRATEDEDDYEEEYDEDEEEEDEEGDYDESDCDEEDCDDEDEDEYEDEDVRRDAAPYRLPPAENHSTTAQQQQQQQQQQSTAVLLPLRRFCIPCGLRHGLHKPGDVLHRRGDAAAAAAWVCRCREARDRGAALAASVCPRCGMRMPLREPARGGSPDGRGDDGGALLLFACACGRWVVGGGGCPCRAGPASSSTPFSS